MEQVTKPAVIAKLRELNPRVSDATIAIYAAAFIEHRIAQENIDQHGAIVFHPRTGSPIDNPYVAARDRASKTLLALDLRTGDLWTVS